MLTQITDTVSAAFCESKSISAVRYVRIPNLLNEMAVARGEGTYHKVVKDYQKVKLLIIDEFLLTPVTNEQSESYFAFTFANGGHREREL